MILLLLEIRFIKFMNTIQTKSKGKVLSYKSIFISDVHLGHRNSAANKLLEFGAKNVLIKGGHLKFKFVQDIFVNKSEIKIFNNKRYETKNTHGTGCTLSSAITTFLSCGKPIKKACELGIKYVNSAIKTNPKYGKGHGPINHLNSMKLDKKFK